MKLLTLMTLIVCISFLRLALSISTLNAVDITIIEKEILRNYDKDIIPIEDSKNPLNVSFSVKINDMVPPEQTYMHFVIDGHFEMSWKDYRLQYDHISNVTKIPFGYTFLEKIWIPDIYFLQEKQGFQHAVPQTASLVSLHPDGTVFTSRRLSVTSFCPMNLRYYPFDIQSCDFSVQSYSYNKNYLKLLWNPNGGVVGDDKDLFMHHFSQLKITLNASLEYDPPYGTFTRLTMTLKLYRNLSLYLLRDFVPCIMIVMLSWVGFWIHDESVPARVSLGITTVLTMVTFANNVEKNSPSVGLIRSIDSYTLTCQIYVFASLLEYAFIELSVPDRRRARKSKSKSSVETDEEGRSVKSFGPLLFYAGEVHRIDRISRIVFPVSFAVANIIFFLFHRLHPDTVDS